MRRVKKTPNVPFPLDQTEPPLSPADIDSKIYSSKEVKDQLKDDQFSKCVYCECRLNGDFGHIEHYRPKGGYSIPPKGKVYRPGYFWLAYDWKNLLLSCSKCNTVYKANHFALADETTRDIPHRDISRESPMLINPTKDDPGDHIEFHEHIVAPRSIEGKEDSKGRYRIDLLQLNSRGDLEHYRREVWDKFLRWSKTIQVAEELIRLKVDVVRGKQLLDIAEVEMARMMREDAEYSGMFVNQKSV